MGVKGLWSLLLPIGRRVSIETLEGRVLAIDASIWLTQFLKANRDPDSGTVRPGAHLLGFIRRICKLLYHGIRPVFVFDGATPEIKLREVRARRERRDRMTIGVGGSGGLGNDGSIKRMARKLLVTELKKNKELERAKALNLSGKAGTGGGFAPNFNPDIAEEEKGEDSANESAVVYERGNARTHGPTREAEKAGSSKDGSNMIDLSNADEIFESQVQNDWDDDKPNQEIFGDGETSSSSESVQIPREEEEIDFGAIATLPANVRKDIIEKAKRQQRLRTRKEFMPVAADPVAYSQVQLTSFLRSSRLNKTINDAAVKATKGLGDGDGLEGECIASDSTKRFIFVKESDQNCANETADKTGGREQTSRATDKSDGSNTYVLPSSSHRQRIRRKGRSQDSSDDDDLFLFEGRLGSPSHQVAKGGRKQFAESDEGDSENSSIERGGGFLIEDETSSAKLGSASPKLPRSSSLVRKNEDEIQQKNDEMIARALQEEEGDSAIPIDDSEEKDSVYAVEISDFGGTVVSHQHENNDALLAATLQRQEEKAISSGSFFESEEVPIQVDDSDDEMNSAQGEGENSINEYKLSITALHDEDERGVDYGDTSDDDVDWEDADVGESLTSYVQAPKDGNSPLAVRAQIAHVRNQPAMDQGIAGASTSYAEAAVRNHLVSAGGKNVHVLSSPSLQMEPPVPKASANHNSDDKNDNENRRQDNVTARSSSHPSNRRRNMSETDGEVEADLTSDFDLAPSNDANAAALKQAQSTATNLTNWAGRAVRRAIAAHIEETGGGESQPSNMHVEDNAISAPLTNMKKGCTEEGTGKGRAKSSVQKYAVGDEKDGVVEHMEEDEEKQFRLDTAKDAMNNDAIVPSTDVVVPQTLNNSATVFQDSPVKTSLEALTEEHDRLQDEINRKQRDMDTVTDEMKEEIVELLQAFGIPYVEAPAEAEAQCCTLENLRLVDGVVTEDSDAFVFGGERVYKNIFDDKKYVEVYHARDADKDLGLSHNHMVALAMLLGGDYTEGVKGVGIVNGMEVLQAFDVSSSVKDGLSSFRQWLDGIDATDDYNAMTPAMKEFHIKHQSARTRWAAPHDFPSASVLNAYQRPVVDASESEFSWGRPDLEALRLFCNSNIGWEAEETDRIIKPILQAVESSGSRQTRLESYFMRYEDDIKFASVRSKRLRTIFGQIQRVAGDESGKESDAAVEDHYSGGEKKENESVRISKGVKNSKRRKVVDCGAK